MLLDAGVVPKSRLFTMINPSVAGDIRIDLQCTVCGSPLVE